MKCGIRYSLVFTLYLAPNFLVFAGLQTVGLANASHIFILGHRDFLFVNAKFDKDFTTFHTRNSHKKQRRKGDMPRLGTRRIHEVREQVL